MQNNQPKVMLQFDPKDVADNKLFAAIGYLGVLFIVPLVLKKDSKFCQAHGKQGLVLFITEIVIFFVNILPLIGQLIWFVASIIILIVSLKALLTAWRGEYWAIPYVSDYVDKIKI